MNEANNRALRTSILRVIGLYTALEIAGFAAITLSLHFPLWFFILFLAIQLGFQAGLVVFLFKAEGFFYIASSGEQLDHVNIANKVTLLRISMLPLILFLIQAGTNHPTGPILIPVLAVTFLTDMIDGRLSRGLNQVTQMGKILDSVSDYALLFVVAVAYVFYGLLPLWFFILITFRLGFQACGMFIILLKRKKIEPRPTIFGKIAVATTMGLFAAEALKLIDTVATRFAGAFFWLEIAAGIIVALSVLDKGLFFSRELKATKATEAQ